MSTEVIDPPAPDAPPDETPETPWHSTIFAADKPGEFVPDWHTKAPQEEQGKWGHYKDAKSPWDVVEKAEGRVKEAQRALHEKRATDAGLPARPEGAAATPEAMAAYFKARNLPENPDGYGLVKPQSYPDALWNDGQAKAFAKFFHDQEIAPEHAKAISEFAQQLALQDYAVYQQQQAAAAAELETKRNAYVQSEQEGLIKHFGARVDPALKGIEKVAMRLIPDFDPEQLDPTKPEKWIGLTNVRLLESLVASLPRTGDPTRRDMGSANSASVKDVAYWKGLKPEHDDYKAWTDSRHPRHRQVSEDRARAYALEAELNR